jgi:hypothetical protein
MSSFVCGLAIEGSDIIGLMNHAGTGESARRIFVCAVRAVMMRIS